MGQNVLLIEDDEKLGSQISGGLKTAGFEVTWWRTGRAITADVAQQYALLILDLMLPGTHGMDILKALRTHSDLPVLVLSARAESSDKVRALKLGADDYLTKPFWPEELLERVKARLRRPLLQHEGRVKLGDLEVDLPGRSASFRGELLVLTRVEFDLLAALARRVGEAIPRGWLVQNVLDPDRDGTERTLDVHMSRLRKKLGEADLIKTVWGVGYRLVGSR